MKRYFLLLLFFPFLSALAQEGKKYFSLEGSYFYGNIIEHTTNISHLITHRPGGVILSLNRNTYGLKNWEAGYNYPDLGYTFIYQDLRNPHLGENYALYGHIGFYFLNRNLVLKAGHGFAYATNPYHPDTNFHNNAYGSHLLSSTFFSGNLYKNEIYRGLGLQAGFLLVHYSNADFSSPNNSTNTLAVNAGLNYRFDHENRPEYIPGSVREIREPMRYNFVLRGGVNTIGIIGSPAFPFLTISTYADKRINAKSTLQAGTELFLSGAMREHIYQQSVTNPEGGTTGEEDWKRLGVFVGHELTFGKISLITHLGYYAYYPYDKFVDRIYNRAGLQRTLYKDLFGSFSILAHGINAEAIEFSLGYRL